MKRVDCKSISDNTRDPFSGVTNNLFNTSRYGDVNHISTYYYSMNDFGKLFTYEFTVEMEDGNNVADEGMLLTVTGQNGEEYYAMLTRQGNTNKFVGSVSDEKFLFTNWAVSVKSKLPETIDASSVGSGIEDLIAKYGKNYKIVNPETGAEQTLQQYYDYIYNDYVNTYSENQELLREAQQEVVDIFLETMASYDDFLEGDNFDYSNFDGSEESMKALKAHFGIYEGVYADIPETVWTSRAGGEKEIKLPNGGTAWVNVPPTYYESTGTDGRVYRCVVTNEIDSRGHKIEIKYSAAMPLNGDEGYSYIQGIDYGEYSSLERYALVKSSNYVEHGIVEKFDNGDYGTMTAAESKKGDGKNFPTLSNSGISNLQNTGKIFNALHDRIVGTQTRYAQSLGGWRANLDVGFQTDHRQQTKAQINTETAIDGLIESNSSRIDAETRQELGECKDLIRDITSSTECSDFSQALKHTMQNINDVVNTIHDLKEGIVDASTNGLKALKDKIMGDAADAAREATRDAIEEATGIKIPLDVVEACSDLLDAYSSGLLSEAEKKTIELYLKAQALAKKHNVRVPGDKTKGGIGGRSSGGSARATHDPEGIIYEAVLSNPVEGATATLYERAADGTVTVWEATDYGQINPQVTNGSGWYQWFVPEGEWQVRVTAPEGSGLKDNTSKDNAAANLDDGSTAGWLPVMPVQLGINIPLFSTADPEISDVTVSADGIHVGFSLYMDVSTLTEDTVYVKDGDTLILCVITFENAEADPADESRSYATVMILTPKDGSTFEAGRNYTVTVTDGAEAYNGNSAQLTAQAASPEVPVTGITLDRTSVTLTEGETVTLKATVLPLEAMAAVTWSSTDPGVAKVDKGVVTAVKMGSARISASAGGKTAYCTVTVNPAESGDVDWTKLYPTMDNGNFVPYTPPAGGTQPAAATPEKDDPGDSSSGGSTSAQTPAKRGMSGRQNGNNDISLAWDAVSGARSYSLYVKRGRKYIFVCRISGTSADILYGADGRYYVSAGGAYSIFEYGRGKFVKTGTLAADKISGVRAANNVTVDFMVRWNVGGTLSDTAVSYTASVRVYYKPSVKLTANEGSIALKWKKVAGATKYRVYRYVNGKLKLVTETSAAGVKITGTKAGKRYTYAVKALVNGKWTKIYNTDLASIKAK
ncbi:MAG: Ig-like domain-containing protein [Ruminiclostridium sp.]|nr:Ig-like domain-containing protein [Ruminiclostridium sp.]